MKVDPIWCKGARREDGYAAFRGSFELTQETFVSLKIFGGHWFNVFLDGTYFTEGPYRFPPHQFQEYEEFKLTLKPGRHLFAAVVRSEGVSTRILQSDSVPAFFQCECVDENGIAIPIEWKCQPLAGYIASFQRVNPQLAWIEWVDTRLNPVGWETLNFNDQGWEEPSVVEAVKKWITRPIRVDHVRRTRVEPSLMAEGGLTGPFDKGRQPGWTTDEDVSWYHRDLKPSKPTGAWRRYDLGQVRLGCPEVTLEVPAGTVVEFALNEKLTDGKVKPFIPLSDGLSRNLDHFIARGGRQTFRPVAPKGGRFLEIHVEAPPDKIQFVQVDYWERSYFGEPVGSFQTGDELLEKIWMLGVNTLRSCSEDAITDNPTRERGQWTGDVMLSMFICAAAFNDPRLIKRALEQAAYCADSNGTVAGLHPGGIAILPSYAAQWTTMVLNYFDLTGDESLLQELFPFAQQNMTAFGHSLNQIGINAGGWNFVDWGFAGDGQTALNLHALESMRNMVRWCRLLGQPSENYLYWAALLESVVWHALHPRLRDGKWPDIGYHLTVLAYRNGAIPVALHVAARAYMMGHILSCFPNAPNAPRLSAPHQPNPQVITPYFAYYAFPILIENGHMDFVLNQYRVAWGWGIKQGLTTQAEVFDLNWSHSHVWASSPTAQLSQYVLGLRPTYQRGQHHFQLQLIPGGLKRASGRVPLQGKSGAVDVQWTRDHDEIHYSVKTSEPIWIHVPGGLSPVKVEDKWALKVKFHSLPSMSGTSRTLAQYQM